MLQRSCIALRMRNLPIKQPLYSKRYLSNYNSADDEQNEQRLSPTLRRLKEELKADKAALQWRKQIGERPGDWNSKFKLFANMDSNSDYLVMMQQPLDLSPKGLKAWWHRRQAEIERHMQQYMRERVDILGPELAVSHFILYRGGAVRFTHSPKWLRADENGEFDLPKVYAPQYKVEALRCDNMVLYYEGLENIRNLGFIKFLSFRNIKTFDDWCLDRISGAQLHTLEILDISGTQCTVRGLSCLYRMSNLRLLIVDDPRETLEYELTCAMLCEALPQLKVIGADKIHGDDKAFTDEAAQ